MFDFLLSELDLSHNNIRYLSKDLIPDLQYGNTSINLKIKENRLECDCHNQWLIEYAKIMQSENMKCTNPKDLKGLKMKNVEIDSIPCPHEDIFDDSKVGFGIPDSIR